MNGAKDVSNSKSITENSVFGLRKFDEYTALHK